ncbi:glycosyltransferase family 2 protein [Anatilimnocola floriformis]|uniref:glycosyltransferase family 2 protein n=1 Tax=Anatilimnocola floriformis TaxID=2948575 RepID=UPI0020C57924|nr:glycosyltransferase family 2 protein [Anatilimnocola floriformis]
MPRLTVLIPCKDERRNILACIESVRAIADEILIADSGSTDGSLEMIRAAGGCRIIEREYVNSADFKNWAIPQAKHEWVLVVDADERVTPALAAEIKTLLASEPAQDGYWLRRDFFFLGHQVKHGCFDTAKLTRLFRRDCRYAVRRVHSDIVVPSGKIAPLTHRLQHFTANDLGHFVDRQHRYANWSAEDSFEKGKRVGILKMLTHAPLRFLQNYIFRGVFLDGAPGLVVCGLMAYYTFLKDIKLWALANDRSADAEQIHAPPAVEVPALAGSSATRLSKAA